MNGVDLAGVRSGAACMPVCIVPEVLKLRREEVTIRMHTHLTNNVSKRQSIPCMHSSTMGYNTHNVMYIATIYVHHSLGTSPESCTRPLQHEMLLYHFP